jgi:transcriptional regulator with XRE-family HTH domain
VARDPLPPGPKERQLKGSAHGAEVVRSRFAQKLTRRRFCDLVGVHPTTLRRWERAGIVRPRLEEVLGSPTWVFSEEDVAFATRLIGLLRDHPGQLTLADAAVAARRRRPRESRS